MAKNANKKGATKRRGAGQRRAGGRPVAGQTQDRQREGWKEDKRERKTQGQAGPESVQEAVQVAPVAEDAEANLSKQDREPQSVAGEASGGGADSAPPEAAPQEPESGRTPGRRSLVEVAMSIQASAGQRHLSPGQETAVGEPFGPWRKRGSRHNTKEVMPM